MLLDYIPVSQIDVTDRLFHLDHMVDSPLQWDGLQPLYNPIWLQQKAPSEFRIVDGFRVVARAGSVAPQSAIPAMVFPEDSNLFQLWKQRLQKRELEGNLSVFAYLKSLSGLMAERKIHSYPADDPDGFFPQDILQQTFEDHTLQLMLGKEQIISQFADIQQLTFPQIVRLDAMSDPDLAILAGLLDGMHLKGKKLSSLLDLIDELRRGYHIQFGHLAVDESLKTIRTDIPPHQRYGRIKTRLLMLRYPQLNQLNLDWNAQLKQTGLTSVVEIQHHPYFEDDFLAFVFRPHNADDLKKRLQTVLDRADDPNLKQLFSFT